VRFLFVVFFFLIPVLAYAKCDFRTADYIDLMNSPKSIYSIDIKIAKSSKYAKNAYKILISKSFIPNELKKSFRANVVVNYSFGSCQYTGKVRQSGDWKDHIKLIKGNIFQSLDVELKRGNILNAVHFKLLIPETRNGLNEIFATTILRELGFIAPETFQVNTSINGNKLVMLFQEKARKELLERNLRREGPIFRGDEVLIWGYKNYSQCELDRLSLSTLYNKGWFEKGASSQKIILGAYEKLQIASLKSRYYQDSECSKYYLTPDMASKILYDDFMNVLTAMNGGHAFWLNNRKHYYNAISESFEPIYYDGDVDLSIDLQLKNNSSLKPTKFSSYLLQKIESLETKGNLRDEFLIRTSVEDFSLKFFYKAINKFKSNVKKIQAQNELILETKKPNNNVNDLKYLTWYKEFQRSKDLNQKIITDIKIEHDGGYTAQIAGQDVLALSEDEVLSVIFKNNLNNQRAVYIPQKFNSADSIKTDFKKISINGIEIKMSNGMSIQYSVEEKKLIFSQTKSSDWALIHNSSIKGWKVFFNGLKANDIFSNQEQRFNAYGLTGCLTFYNTEIIDSELTIIGGQCEDSLNFIRVNGHNLYINVENAYADAVDADFSVLNIHHLLVSNSGNDCLDLSSGKYLVKISKLLDCRDKGISVGEKSNFEAYSLSIENALIGISVKDFSRATIKKLTTKKISICGEAKRKKQEFGGGKLFIEKTNCVNSYPIDENSIIEVTK